MKIGLIVDASMESPGGVQEYVRGLYDYLDKNGHQTLILTQGQGSPEDEEEGRQIVSLGKAIKIIIPGSSGSFRIIFVSPSKLKKFLEKENFDILHFQAPFGLLGYGLLFFSKSKNIFTFHIYNDSRIANLATKLVLYPLKLFRKKIHGYSAGSKVSAEYANRFLPFQKTRSSGKTGSFKILNYGIDLSRFNPNIEKLQKYQDGKINILFVGRLDNRKGIPYLLEAYKKLSENLKSSRLIIVGSGPKEKWAKKFVRKNNLTSVELAGFVSIENLPKYYATADIFCSPATQAESFGIVLLEAMAAGLPFVGFANHGYQTCFGKFESNFLVENKNIEQLAEALLRLIKDKALREKIGQQNLKDVQEYSWEKVGRRVVKYYLKTLKN